MASTTISNLPSASNVSNDDLFLLTQSGASKKVDFATIKNAIGGGGGGGVSPNTIAPTESGDIATMQHYVGSYFYNKDGKFCLTTVQINVGSAIVLNTNCVETTVSAELADIYKLTGTMSGTIDNYVAKGYPPGLTVNNTIIIRAEVDSSTPPNTDIWSNMMGTTVGIQVALFSDEIRVYTRVSNFESKPYRIYLKKYTGD